MNPCRSPCRCACRHGMGSMGSLSRFFRLSAPPPPARRLEAGAAATHHDRPGYGVGGPRPEVRCLPRPALQPLLSRVAERRAAAAARAVPGAPRRLVVADGGLGELRHRAPAPLPALLGQPHTGTATTTIPTTFAAAAAAALAGATAAAATPCRPARNGRGGCRVKAAAAATTTTATATTTTTA